MPSTPRTGYSGDRLNAPLQDKHTTSVLRVRRELPNQSILKVAKRNPTEKTLIVMTAFRKRTAAVTHLKEVVMVIIIHVVAHLK